RAVRQARAPLLCGCRKREFMLTGKRFEFRTNVVVLETVKGKRVASIVPKGSTVLVISGPVGDDKIVDVQWQNRTLTMFAIDLDENAIEIKKSKIRPPSVGGD